MDSQTTKELAYHIRRLSLEMVHAANASHIGGALSSADILAVLYDQILNYSPEHPQDENRDRLVFSKGHCCTALYAVLALKGFFPIEDLKTYGQPGSTLICHASHHVPGVEWSTGSLGHGLSLACGQALAGKRKGATWRVYTILSDGDLNEGSSWEAMLFAEQHQLNNLTAIIDYNRQQGLGPANQILSLHSLQDKFEAFGWDVCEVDGHNIAELTDVLSKDRRHDSPCCIIANTIKGKGVKYMEDDIAWHYRAPVTEDLLNTALQQLAESYPDINPS